MGFQQKITNPTGLVFLGPVTTSGTNATDRIGPGVGRTPALLQRFNVTDRIGIHSVWRPLGCYWNVTTATTVTAAVLTLRKNGVNITGAIITVPVQAADQIWTYAPFPNYAPGVDAAGDRWDLVVTTTSTAGVVEFTLEYAVIAVPGITETVGI